MQEGERKQKYRVLNERRGLFVNVLILEYLLKLGSIEDSQETLILLSQLSGALPLDRIYKVGFPACSCQIMRLGRETQDELREGPLS